MACAAVKEMLPEVSTRDFSERAGLVSVHSLAELWRKVFKPIAEGDGEGEEQAVGREVAVCPRAGQARLDKWA